MHRSAYAQMALSVDTYVPSTGRLRVVDIGSRKSAERHPTHRTLFDGRDYEYIGVDVREGPNVDVVMRKPYRLPVRSNSADVVVSGQVFEHVPFFWATMLEIARVLKPGGHAIITAPSRGHEHNVQDCWRFYPDGMRSLAAWSGLELREAFTDFPPRQEASRLFDFSAIQPDAYWGDSVGVFRKTDAFPRLRMAAVRALTLGWADHIGGIEDTPRPDALPARRRWRRFASTAGR